MGSEVMAVYTRELAADIVFPNINVYRIFKDGVLDGYEVKTADVYVMYDTAANDTELDPDTMEEVPVTYYYTIMSCPKTKDFSNFTWVAVPRDSVDENYIFGGGGDNNHEVM